MSIETGLKAHLAADSSVAAIVGTEIYQVVLPQDFSLPAITYIKVSGRRVKTLSGPTGSARPRFQIDSWANTYSEAKALATAVRQSLDGHKGSFGGESNVGGISLESEIDDFNEDAEMYRVIQDYFIPHTETP